MLYQFVGARHGSLVVIKKLLHSGLILNLEALCYLSGSSQSQLCESSCGEKISTIFSSDIVWFLKKKLVFLYFSKLYKINFLTLSVTVFSVCNYSFFLFKVITSLETEIISLLHNYFLRSDSSHHYRLQETHSLILLFFKRVIYMKFRITGREGDLLYTGSLSRWPQFQLVCILAAPLHF